MTDFFFKVTEFTSTRSSRFGPPPAFDKPGWYPSGYKPTPAGERRYSNECGHPTAEHSEQHHV